MATIAEKLAYLLETKRLIKQAIQSKGITVTDNDTFRDYADKIDQIDSANVYEIYNGSYNITPKVTSQTLNTDQKVMSDDVTIQGIPISRTSNNEGGQTILIGGN